jgi:hypothetical protein
MANTYEAIAKTVLTTTQATITFSGIASTYTDLVLLVSGRSDHTAFSEDIKFWYNNNSAGSSYSFTRIFTDTPNVTSNRSSGFPWGITGGLNENTNTTANTFSSTEIYIPNYAGSTYKPNSVTTARENNSTTYYTVAGVANLWQDSAAINRIDLAPRQGTNFLSGSSFYLYGIKNS